MCPGPMPAWLSDGQRDYVRTPPNSQELHTDWTAHISVGSSPQARIFGRAGVKIATLQTGSHHFVLISVKPANLYFMWNAREDWWVCGQAWQCPHCKQPPILSAMADESIYMKNNQSLSQNNCNWFPGSCHMRFHVCILLATLADQSLWLCTEPLIMSSWGRVFEWHIPENVVDQMNDVLVQDIFFLDKFIRGRATGSHNKSDSGTAQQALKHIILTCPVQRP